MWLTSFLRKNRTRAVIALLRRAIQTASGSVDATSLVLLDVATEQGGHRSDLPVRLHVYRVAIADGAGQSAHTPVAEAAFGATGPRSSSSASYACLGYRACSA